MLHSLKKFLISKNIKRHHLFKSLGNFAGWVDFAYQWSEVHRKGFVVNVATPSKKNLGLDLKNVRDTYNYKSN